MKKIILIDEMVEYYAEKFIGESKDKSDDFTFEEYFEIVVDAINSNVNKSKRGAVYRG